MAFQDFMRRGEAKAWWASDDPFGLSTPVPATFARHGHLRLEDELLAARPFSYWRFDETEAPALDAVTSLELRFDGALAWGESAPLPFDEQNRALRLDGASAVLPCPREGTALCRVSLADDGHILRSKDWLVEVRGGELVMGDRIGPAFSDHWHEVAVVWGGGGRVLVALDGTVVISAAETEPNGLVVGGFVGGLDVVASYDRRWSEADLARLSRAARGEAGAV